MSRVLIVDNPPLFRTLEASSIHRADGDPQRPRSEEIVRVPRPVPGPDLLDTSTPGSTPRLHPRAPNGVAARSILF